MRSTDSRLSDHEFADDATVPGMSEYTGPSAEWLRADRRRLAVWCAGYEAGARDGFSDGVDWANDGWTLTTAAACRAGLALGELAELQRRRREFAHSMRCTQGSLERRRRCDGSCFRPRTAAEIMRDAAESWAEVEAEIARRGQVAS
jgi:hypothetical protein